MPDTAPITPAPITAPAATIGNVPIPKTTDYSSSTVANSDGNGGQTTVYSVVPPAVPNPAPVNSINSSITAPSNPAVQPTPTTSTPAASALGASLAAFKTNLQSLSDSLTKDQTTTPTTPVTTTPDGMPAPDQSLAQVLKGILTLNDKLATKGQATADANKQQDVSGKTQKVQDLTNEYNSRSEYYDNQIALLQKGGGDATQIGEQISQVTAQKNRELADIAIQQSAASGNLTVATTLAKQAVDAQFEPIQSQIDNLKTYYSLAQNDLTSSEQKQADAAIQAKQSALDEQKQMRLDAYQEKIKQSDPLYQAQTAEAYANAAKSRASAVTGDLATVTTPSGTQVQIPQSVVPYYNTSQNGTGWVDASTLQGTAAEKTKIINAATATGIKVITNKNQAADLSNIKDVNNKLDTISGVMANIDQPGSLSRGLYGIGLTSLATMAQTNPQQAASGALSSVGLDVLKAISGVQGFRGNQAAIAQVQSHLPTVYDTNAVAQQKIAYIRTLVTDREDGLLGNNSIAGGSTAPAGTTLLTGPDGKPYNVPNDKVSAFIAAGGH